MREYKPLQQPRGYKPYTQNVVNTTTFYGLNRGLTVTDGEMNEMMNLTSDYYPQLAPCLPRRNMEEWRKFSGAYHGSIAKGNDIYTACGTHLLKNGTNVDGVTLTDEGNNGSPYKLMVSMGAYILIWPDKVYYNTIDRSEADPYTEDDPRFGPMGALWQAEDGVHVSASPCNIDGEDVSYIKSDTQPTTKDNGAYWFDTKNKLLMIYNGAAKEWQEVNSTYIRLQARGISRDFRLNDGLYISDSTDPKAEKWQYHSGEDAVREQLNTMINTAYIVYKVPEKDEEQDYIVITGLIQDAAEIDHMQVERRIPDFHFACEANNRIWGCQYGNAISLDGTYVNQLMACALGDFKNWEQYDQVSTDSYAVSLGSDGPFTGAISLNGVPYFFKEGSFVRIAGSYPEQFTTDTMSCRGVDAGDQRSLCRIEQSIIYKGLHDITLFNNGSFSSLGVKLGQTALADDVTAACVHGLKYYALVPEKGIYVYDYARGLWHMESAEGVHDVAATDEHMFFLMQENGEWYWRRQTTEAERAEGRVEWSATFGAWGYDLSLKKYLTRFDLRMQMQVGSVVQVYIQYDHDGRWHKVGTIMGRTVNSFLVPVVPRRCDHCQIRLDGKGQAKLLGFARILEQGSDA